MIVPGHMCVGMTAAPVSQNPVFLTYNTIFVLVYCHLCTVGLSFFKFTSWLSITKNAY